MGCKYRVMDKCKFDHNKEVFCFGGKNDCQYYTEETKLNVMQTELIAIAEEFNKWLDNTSHEHNIDKNAMQNIIKQFLIG